jgi:hypothetical protein
MLPFGVTIPDSVPQRSEIPEGLMNYPVLKVVLVKTLVVRFTLIFMGTAAMMLRHTEIFI